MTLRIVATGSTGNCYLLEENGHFLILDCGESVPWRWVIKASGYRPSKIDAALITHRHLDHLPRVKEVHMSGIPIYSNDETESFVLESQGEKINGLPEKKKSELKGGWSVVPWYVPHEDVANFAYLIYTPSGEKVAYITDFEYSPVTLKSYGVNAFLIAVSRTEEIDKDAEAREHRIRGHSSLEVVKDFLNASITEDCRHIIACHLSGIYADEKVVFSELSEAFPNTQVSIAHKGMTINLSEVKA